jgi:predicted 2-oxoglutarate/Fe(II)-dependent dioxygenase YbiX
MNKKLCNRLIEFATGIVEWKRFDHYTGKRYNRFDAYWMQLMDPLYMEVEQDLFAIIQNARTYKYQMRLSRYNVGDYIDRHADNAIPTRRISVVTQLSDPTDYEGGDLILDSSGVAPREKGSYVVFESQKEWHEVTPVTKGVRYTMVYWLYEKDTP